MKILFCFPYRFPSHNLPLKTNIPSLSEVFYHHTTLLAHRIYNNPLPDIDLHFRRTKRHNFIIDHHTDNYSINKFMDQAWIALPFDLKPTIKITTLKGLTKKKRSKQTFANSLYFHIVIVFELFFDYIIFIHLYLFLRCFFYYWLSFTWKSFKACRRRPLTNRSIQRRE